MPSLIELVVTLAEIFDRLGVRFAVGGALASNFWGVVRATQDIDCLVALPALRYQEFADELSAIGCELRNGAGELFPIEVAALREQARQRKLIECFHRSIRIELFVPVIPLQEELLRRAVLMPLGGREIPVTTAEDLILLKLAFHRVKDLQDVRGMLWVQRGRLDLQYLRNWSSKSLEPQVQQELEHLIQEFYES